MLTATNFLTKTSLESRYGLVSDAFKAQVSKQDFEGVLLTLKQSHGELISFKLENYSSKGVNDYTYYSCLGSTDTVNYKFVINRYTGLINGLFLVDAIPKNTYVFPRYIHNEEVLDSIFNFKSDGLNFIAKTTYASNLGKRKIRKNSQYTFVLLSGSGPSMIDGQLFSNQTYTELSVGLSQLGYNCVRFNKRSSFNISIENNQSVEQEYYNDAKSLIQILHQRGHKKIIILGHSLGGYLGLELLKDDDLAIQGFISLCAPSGNVLDLMVDQISRLNELNKLEVDSQGTSEELSNPISSMLSNEFNLPLDSLVMGAPVSYWSSLNKFQPKYYLDSTQQKVFLLHGSHDFQVNAEENKAWKKELGKGQRFHFKIIHNMNHLLVNQPKNDNPSYYQIKNGISKKLIKQIDCWTKKL